MLAWISSVSSGTAASVITRRTDPAGYLVNIVIGVAGAVAGLRGQPGYPNPVFAPLRFFCSAVGNSVFGSGQCHFVALKAPDRRPMWPPNLSGTRLPGPVPLLPGQLDERPNGLIQ
jgi:uncharacterized membrane protein YeaQ/YmgE (transglycosylase-associated protein family)